MIDPAHHTQSCAAVAQGSDDAAVFASAERREGVHDEPDPEQIAKVVHDVKSTGLPLEGPTNVSHGRFDGASVTDVAITPRTASVWEARRFDPDDAYPRPGAPPDPHARDISSP